VIAEDLLEGVFVDPLPCECHSARLYHGLAAEASRLFTPFIPSHSIAFPRRDRQHTECEKRKFLYVPVKCEAALESVFENSGVSACEGTLTK
jgi:hypothetical protein